MNIYNVLVLFKSKICDRPLVNEQNPTFESFNDKSNQLQRVTLIFLGATFFFFFMILLPYFSFKVDSHHLSILHDLSDRIIGNITYIREKIITAPVLPPSVRHIGNMDLTDSAYYEILNNNKTNVQMLSGITSTSCTPKSSGFLLWLSCNLNNFHELPPKNLPGFQLNFTETKDFINRINNTIALHDTLLRESKNIQMNVSNYVDSRVKLKNLNGYLNSNRMSSNYTLIPSVLGLSVLGLSDTLKTQDKILSYNTNVFLNRFNASELPIIGRVPIGVNDIVDVFPIALAISFFYFIAILRDTIRLRRVLEKDSETKKDDIGKYLSSAPLWIDPKRPKCQTGQTLHLIMSWIVLALPGALFIASVSLILYMWDYMYIRNDAFPPFAAALNLNEYIYHILYGISSGIFIIAYIVLLKEVKAKDPIMKMS